jgi:hypothetical protein
MTTTRVIFATLPVALLVAGCGGGALPAVGPSRESGQSSLMGQTFAGKNACDPKSHDRPFIIEWDATDMSMFENRAATDVVFVKYEGCELKVLDACANDSIRGSLGAYRPVEWTSGSVEKINISNEGELYAKLPLGVATLGGRVSAGEKFAMEYFVSGVRTATRSAAYRDDLAKIPGCKGATHVVYGYSLGAFALGTEKKMGGDVEVGVKGIGGGAKGTHQSSAEKKGGLIDSCRAESAKEVKSCQVPIRLMLRELEAGSSPEANTTASGPAPGAPPARSDKPEVSMDEIKLRESAARKRVAKDGAGCLADLDAADKQWPNSARLSTRPDGMMNIRGACLMLKGDCESGKKLYRQAMERYMPNAKPEVLDTVVKVEADQSCPKK